MQLRAFNEYFTIRIILEHHIKFYSGNFKAIVTTIDWFPKVETGNIKELCCFEDS